MRRDDADTASTTTQTTATTATAPAGAGGLPSGVPDQGGRTVEGTGYAVTLPGGWADGTEASTGGAVNFDLVLVRPPEDGFATNVNIIRVESPRAPDVDDLRRAYRGELDAVGAQDIGDARDTTLDGEDAITYEYRQTGPQGQAVRGRQIAAVRDGAVHTITLTALADGFAAAEAGFEEIIGSWSWGG